MIHDFLRSVGFKDLTDSRRLCSLLEDIVRHPDTQQVSLDAYGNEIGSFSRSFGKDFGLSVCGDFYENNEFHIEYYFPYFYGSSASRYEELEVEKHAAREAFSGICDEIRLGVTLIFFINNPEDIMAHRQAMGSQFDAANVALTGLASSGKILLPVVKNSHARKIKEEASRRRIHLLQEAKEGSQSAIDDLTLSDMNTYTMLSRRVRRQEDILSIVESSFIPYGMESDQYLIIGEILDFSSCTNSHTSEELWRISVNCNDVCFDILINKRDLFGEPKIGRRFRGRIQMQGHINFT